MKKPLHIKRLLYVSLFVTFLAFVPWAINYNLNYDKYGSISKNTEPVFIQIVTAEAGNFNNTLKQKASQYINRNQNVRIFVLPLTAEQIQGSDFDIKIIKDNGAYYTFISPSQTSSAILHCENFLDFLTQELENIKIYIN